MPKKVLLQSDYAKIQSSSFLGMKILPSKELDYGKIMLLPGLKIQPSKMLPPGQMIRLGDVLYVSDQQIECVVATGFEKLLLILAALAILALWF